MHIPPEGLPPTFLLERLRKAKAGDVDWKRGRSWSLVYYAGEEHTEFLKTVYSLYFSENGAGPSMFPSLRQMEAEVVSMALNLMGGDSQGCGTMTSGGTESILLAMKAYRDWTRTHRPHITAPEILIPESAHPAFLKAANYFDLQAVPIPLNNKFEVDIQALKTSITDQTICLVGSAPSFPHGVMDPISTIGALAKDHEIGLHVDACLGGFLLPFIKQLGHDVPPFDFQVPGVTSISLDLHKNGYTAKGASAILYRQSELRRNQFFVSSDWPGGLHASPTLMGTRPGGAIAAAWAALMVLGENGYEDIARRTMETTKKLKDGIGAFADLAIIGNPVMSVFGFTSNTLDIFALGDRIDSNGWRINRQNHPPALHLVVTPHHASVVDDFLATLQESVEAERKNPSLPRNRQGAILYGGSTTLDHNDNVQEVLLTRLENQYRL